jgi:hypothetical protein
MLVMILFDPREVRCNLDLGRADLVCSSTVVGPCGRQARLGQLKKENGVRRKSLEKRKNLFPFRLFYKMQTVSNLDQF